MGQPKRKQSKQRTRFYFRSQVYSNPTANIFYNNDERQFFGIAFFLY